MKMSRKGLIALAAREAVVLTTYKDSKGIPTIGLGHTANAGAPVPTPGLKLTLAEAIDLFAHDVARYEADVSKAVTVPLEQHEFDALVSFHFNTGGIARANLTKLLKAGDRAGAAAAFMGWVKPPEVTARRAAERHQFETGDYGSTFGLVWDAKPGTAKRVDLAALIAEPAPAAAAAPAAPASPAAPAKPVPAGQWAEQVLAVYEVKAVQQRLRDLGYLMVGKVDGDWGPNTVAAISALQAQAGIAVDGHFGPATKAALADDANRHAIAPARLLTTADDLRAQGSATVRRADKITLAAIGGIAMTTIEGVVYVAQHYQSTELPLGSSLVFGFLPPGVAAAAPIIAQAALCGYAWLKAKGVIQARVEDERTGLHNGEPEPAAGAPTPSGGILGGLFGLGKPA